VGSLMACHFTKGMYVLDTFDFWVGNFGLFILSLFQTILIAWIWGPENMLKELQHGSKIKVPAFICWGMKYVSAPYLVIIMVMWSYRNAGSYLREVWENPLAQMVVGYLAFSAFFYMVVTFFTLLRWKRKKLTKNE
ncbi:MAG: hypothetical protein IJK97_12530, partial [Thermoguttaceae bacterium]|nr:hypothetical protein [Thermoguttaceae bacterium]